MKTLQKLLILIFILFPGCIQPEEEKISKIHKAHLTQGWYPNDKSVLIQNLSSYLNIAKQNFPVSCDSKSVKALIVPHAGHYFSGLCAACGYQSLINEHNQKNGNIKKVIILCPSHVSYLRGIALPDYTTYQTVMGDIRVDQESIKKLKNDIFKIDEQAHGQEHAIEIQLPFLQQVIQKFKMIPLIVGQLATNEYEIIAKQLKEIVTKDTLVVVSSDFIHYGKSFDYAPFEKNIFYNIRNIDSDAIEAISNLSLNDFSKVVEEQKPTICGQASIKILLKLIELNSFENINEAQLSCYYTSPQLEEATKNNRTMIDVEKLLQNISDSEMQHSVSYASLIFNNQDLTKLERENLLTGFEKESLLTESRDVLKNSFEINKVGQKLLYPIKSFAVSQESGAFVTLNTKSGDLRGCIGRITTPEPLYKTVADMTLAAAFEDSRFKPLKKDELKNIVIDITVLTQPEKVGSYKEIILGKHGIILKKDWASAVFLPQVQASFGWDLPTTLEHLSQKAGLSKDGWKQNCDFAVFEGFEIKEK
ncbi:MAG: AmmeMemoRadiSam system protein B [bacterium]